MARTFGVGLAILTIVALAWLFRMVERYDPLAAERERPIEEVILTAEESFMLARYRGQPRWTMKVRRMGLRTAPGADPTEFHTADFEHVSDGTVYSDGRPRAYFSAKQAQYHRLPRTLAITGDLRLRSVEGETFEAPACRWSEDDKVARFPSGAYVRIKKDELKAPEMMFDPERSLIRCQQGATAKVRGHVVTAANLEWDLDDKRIACGGPVTGSHGKATFRAESAFLDLEAQVLRVNKGVVDIRMESQ